MTRVIVLTPTLDGHDGVSALARGVVTALSTALPACPLAVWSLTETHPLFSAGRAAVWGAGRNRARFVARAVAEAREGQRRTIVVIIHAHLLPVAAPLAWRGASLVAWLIGIESWRPYSLVQSQLIRRAACRLAISEYTVHAFRRANPDLASLPVEVCRPALPTLAVPATDRVAPAGPYALIVGRMAADERYKGHDVLLEIWSSVVASVPDARLLVVGGGDDERRLQDRARALAVDGSVQFLGAVEPAVLSALYRDATMLLLPSTREGFGLVLLEAMSFGKPCIAAPGAAAEIVQHEETGLIVDPAKTRDLTLAIVRLFQQTSVAAGMGAAGARRVAALFSPARFASDVARAMAPLVKATPPC